MQKERKIEILSQLGMFLAAVADHNDQNVEKEHLDAYYQAQELMTTVRHANAWFTEESVRSALKAWGNSLTTEKLEAWLAKYKLDSATKKVGVIMAGNIPLVGLHDAISVLLSNHILHAKLASKDEKLMGFVLNFLKQIAPEWQEQIVITESLKDIDTLIATGSDNSARYFEYYFRDKQKLIRKNRTSVAILKGEETEEDLNGLADDVFTHYGLGCRNVTKVYLPKGFDKDKLFGAFFKYKEFAEHNAYANNYDYNKAVYLLNSIDLVENGFLLLKQDEGLHSPVGVLFYEEYENLDAVLKGLEEEKNKIQCLVSKLENEHHIPFGKAQSPELWDYADGVDTLEFLAK